MQENLQDQIDSVAARLHRFETEISASQKRKDLYVLGGHLRLAVFSLVRTASEPDTKNEIIKGALKKALSLHDRDAVLFMNDKIIIRLFDFSKTEKKEAESGGGGECRFKGLPPEELEAVRSRIGRRHDLDLEILKAVDAMLLRDLDFAKIDNQYFADNFIKLLQKSFRFMLGNLCTEDEIVIDGLSNYLLREYFDKILFRMAEKLVLSILNGSKKCENFVKFYNGEVIIRPSGAKIKKPHIIDENNNALTPQLVLQAAINKKIIEDKYKKSSLKLSAFEKKQQLLQKHSSDWSIEVEMFQKERVQALRLNESASKKMNEYKEALLQMKRQKMPQEQIGQMAVKVKQLMKKEEELLHRCKQFDEGIEKTGIKIQSAAKEITALAAVIQNEKRIHEKLTHSHKEGNEKYNSAISALARALSQYRG